MGNLKSAAAALLAALSIPMAQAHEEKGAHQTTFYVEPYAGSTHLRINADRLYQETEIQRMDAFTRGITLGLRAPYGLVVEAGYSEALHVDFFDWFNDEDDFDLAQAYGAIGWQFDLGRGWQIAPRVGRERWELRSDHRVLLDGAGARQVEISGYENFWELAVVKDVNDLFSIGINLKDASHEYGHARAGHVQARFRF